MQLSNLAEERMRCHPANKQAGKTNPRIQTHSCFLHEELSTVLHQLARLFFGKPIFGVLPQIPHACHIIQFNAPSLPNISVQTAVFRRLVSANVPVVHSLLEVPMRLFVGRRHADHRIYGVKCFPGVGEDIPYGFKGVSWLKLLSRPLGRPDTDD